MLTFTFCGLGLNQSDPEKHVSAELPIPPLRMEEAHKSGWLLMTTIWCTLNCMFKQIKQDDSIADILNSAIPVPEQSKTPAGNKQTLLEQDLWADCDRGMAAQQ